MAGPPEGFNPPPVEGQGNQTNQSENSSQEAERASDSSGRRSFFPEVDQAELKRAEEKEKDRVRQQLGTVKKEFVQSKAQEAAKQQIAKETRALPWWRQAGQVIRSVPSFLREQKSTTNQRAQEYAKDFQRREEIKARLAATGLKESEEKQLYAELAQLEAKLQKGQGVALTEQEQKFFDELQQIIATKRGELDLEDQKLKDRAEAGKLIEWFRSHPNARAGLLAAGVGLVAGATIPLLGIFGTTGLMAIKGGLAGGVAGLAGKEARVHAPTEWARDVGLLVRDKSLNIERFKTAAEMAAMTNQELTRAVGVIKNALEQGRVGGSRGEYVRLWSLYRQANDVLVERSQKDHSAEQETVDQAGLRRIAEAIQAKKQATDDYDRLLRNALSEQEWETYLSIQRGKGKQEYGAAILGAAVGAAVGGMYGVWSEQRAAAGGMQNAVEEWHKVYREGILRQHERAVAKSAELATQNIQAMGMEPGVVTEFAQKVGRESVQSLADFARSYNISLAHPLYEPNVTFGQWLTSNAEWFRSLSPKLQAEVLSHPNLGPILLERGATATTLIEQGLYSLGALIVGGLGRERLERQGKSEIGQSLKASEDRYGQHGKEEWERAKRAREEDQKKLEDQRRESTDWTEQRKRQEEEEPKKIEEQRQERLKLLQVGQRFELTVKGRGERKSTRKEFHIIAIGKNPQTGNMGAQMISGGDSRFVDLIELIDPDMSAYRAAFVGFTPQETKTTKALTPTSTAGKELAPVKNIPDEELRTVYEELITIQQRNQKTYNNARKIRDRLLGSGSLAEDKNRLHHLAERSKQGNKKLYDMVIDALNRSNPSTKAPTEESRQPAETTT